MFLVREEREKGRGLEDEYRGEMAQWSRPHKRSIFRLSSGSVPGEGKGMKGKGSGG